MAIRTIIFDIDETLYSYIGVHSQLIEEVDQECSRVFGWAPGEAKALWKQSYARAREILGYHNAAIHDTMLRFQFMLEAKGINPLPYAQKMHRQYWDTFIERMTPEPFAYDFILSMREKGIQIGVATDMMADIQYRKLEKLGLIDLVDFIVTSEETGYEKPHEKFFEACLAKAGCKAEECIMIGDNWDKDIAGALKAGMQAAWYRSEELEAYGYGLPQYVLPKAYQKEVEEEREKYLFTSYPELKERISDCVL